MPKLLKIRRPRIRITSKGIRVTKPTARIGGKAVGVNLSSQGASVSTKVAGVTANSGNKRRRAGCGFMVLLPLAVPALLVGIRLLA